MVLPEGVGVGEVSFAESSFQSSSSSSFQSSSSSRVLWSTL